MDLTLETPDPRKCAEGGDGWWVTKVNAFSAVMNNTKLRCIESHMSVKASALWPTCDLTAPANLRDRWKFFRELSRHGHPACASARSS